MPPLQGLVSDDAGSPGGCPGLFYPALSGLVRCGLCIEVRGIGFEVPGTGVWGAGMGGSPVVLMTYRSRAGDE